MKLCTLPASRLDPKKPRPGIYLGVPFDQYTETEALNNSKMGIFVETQSWSEVRSSRLNTDTVSTRFGSMFHQAFLEPLLFAQKVEFGGPINPSTGNEYGRGTKKWAEFEETAKLAGKMVLAHDDREDFAKMVLAARHNPHAKRILGSKTALREVTMIAEMPYASVDGQSGTVMVKTRPDLFDPGTGRLSDLKTTVKPIGPAELGKTFARFGYYRAGALYLDVAEMLTGEKFDGRWVVLKRHSPWDCVVCELPEQALELGRAEYRTIVPEYAACLESGWWPSYGGYWSGGEKRIAVVGVDLPRWKLSQFVDGE